MVTKQHHGIGSGYYPLHDKFRVFGNITLWFRLDVVDNLLGSQDSLVDCMLDVELLGNLNYAAFLKPPAVNPHIEQDEASVLSVARAHRLNLWPITLSEEDDFLYVGELLEQLFTSKDMLKMANQRGWKLSVICPASIIRGELVLWLPEYPNVSSINLFVDLSLIDCSELRASIIPLDERLPILL